MSAGRQRLNSGGPMLQITRQISIDPAACEIHAIRAQGAGGQNVNKVSSAVHLRFDSAASSLPDDIKQRILELNDRRIGSDGVIVIKAQRHRSQDRNREDALMRLQDLLRSAAIIPRTRKPTRPTGASRRKRVDEKVKRGQIKVLRSKAPDET
jgi:ribosome-associated protein